MITAERFAGRFASYWNAVLPRLDHFVRVSNLGPRRLAPRLDVNISPERQALVSETGFMLWATKSTDHASADRAARTRLADLVPSLVVADPATAAEIEVAHALASRIELYTTTVLTLTDIQVEPRLPGCGTISGGVPDMLAVDHSYGRALRAVVEVKSADRTFRSTDFRQLVAYAGLIFASRQELPDLFVLINPLRGTGIEVGVAAFFDAVAGTPADLSLQRLTSEWSDPRLSA